MKDYAHQPYRPAIKKTKFQRFWAWWKALLFIFSLVMLLNVSYIADPASAETIGTQNEIGTIVVSEPHSLEIRVIPPEPKTVEDFIHKYFKEDADWAFRCLESENRSLNPYAVNYNKNGSVDRGIFQINSVHCGKVQGDCATALFDIETNVKIGKQIFDTQGKSAWYGRTCK